MHSNPKLMPCRFCGDRNPRKVMYDAGLPDPTSRIYRVECVGCHACTDNFCTDKSAIDEWNNGKVYRMVI